MDLNPQAIDIGLHWLAVLFYIGATIANAVGLIFLRERAERLSYSLLAAGLLIHSAALAFRWYVSGHGPYLARYEVLSSCAWVALVFFLFYRRLYPALRQASIIVFPASFLLVAVSLFLNPEIKKLPPTFSGIWLVLHVGFYKISLATLLIALAFSLLFIMTERTSYQWLNKLPPPAVMDNFAYRFTGFAFIFWGIAMLAGSIWAYQSWGRFWGWDAIETWSLITWIFFGLYLHLRRFFGWRGQPAAWLFLVCFCLSILSLFFVGFISASLHSEYFQ